MYADIEFQIMCCMLQKIKLFQTVQHAVKHADIELLQHLVDSFIVFFFDVRQHNYDNEMLFYQWNLLSVNASELQHAILISDLMNWSKREITYKLINLRLEHLNNNYKIKMKCYKNSIYNVNLIFDHVCLSNTWV